MSASAAAAAGADDSADASIPFLHNNCAAKLQRITFEPLDGSVVKCLRAGMIRMGFSEDVCTALFESLSEAGEESMVMAGSAVLHAILTNRGERPDWEAGDFDIFATVEEHDFDYADIATIRAALGEEGPKITALRDALRAAGLAETRRDSASYSRMANWSVRNIYEYASEGGGVIQLIVQSTGPQQHGHATKRELRMLPVDVVRAFDFDLLRHYFDGTRVMMSDVAEAAIADRVVGVPETITCYCHEVSRFGKRARKYAARGFGGGPLRVLVQLEDLYYDDPYRTRANLEPDARDIKTALERGDDVPEAFEDFLAIYEISSEGRTQARVGPENKACESAVTEYVRRPVVKAAKT